LRTVAASRGAVNVAAKAVFLILTCLACIVTGFLLPMVPGASAVIGGAFWAGLLASGGALAGMAVSDAILARIEPRNAAGQPQPDRWRRAKRRARAFERRPMLRSAQPPRLRLSAQWLLTSGTRHRTDSHDQ
jgi:hypothetical protein